MSSYRSRGSGFNGNDRRSYQAPMRDDFYDERRSRSRSPGRRRRSPPYDIARGRQSSSGDDQLRNRSPDQWRERSREGGDDGRRRNSSPRHSRGYFDRDRPDSRDASTPDIDRPSSRGRPSKEIMMEGLAPHLTENDISTELRQHYQIDNLDDVRIIRDRQTKQSREFGFLRFSILEDAQAFMDRNYPVLYLYGDSSRANSNPDTAKVRISYGRERKENRSEDSDWNCSSVRNLIGNVDLMTDFRSVILTITPPVRGASGARLHEQVLVSFFLMVVCANGSEFGPAGGGFKAANIGDNDASPDNTPSQFLLFRGLEPSVTEEHFAKGVAKLNKPTGSSVQPASFSAKKSKVASTTGDANLGAREGTLRRVFLVRDRRSNDSWRYGFAEFATIEDAQAALTRYNSFDRYTIASKQVLVSYIHAGVFVPVLNPSPSVERFLFSPLTNPSLKLQYWDEDAYITELVISKPDSAEKSKGNNLPSDSQGFKSAKDIEKAKKRKAQSDSTTTPGPKKAPSQLQFWSNRHAELHGIERKNGSQANSDAGSDDAPPSQSFADSQRLCCYLCMRQFKSMAELNKHERLSDLHRQNLKDPGHVERAKHKLEKHGVQPSNSGADVSSKDYRDRARERRKIYGVVNKKGEQIGKGPRASQAHSNSDDEGETDAARAPSKGASLLSKMGYTAGQGLGATGEGMKEALKQDVYVAGVGLGAEGGKVGDAIEEAEKNTKGDYKSWIDKGRDNMRERYRNMG